MVAASRAKVWLNLASEASKIRPDHASFVTFEWPSTRRFEQSWPVAQWRGYTGNS
jgi:hypothetical protein